MREAHHTIQTSCSLKVLMTLMASVLDHILHFFALKEFVRSKNIHFSWLIEERPAPLVRSSHNVLLFALAKSGAYLHRINYAPVNMIQKKRMNRFRCPMLV
jgi:hypothetical protein